MPNRLSFRKTFSVLEKAIGVTRQRHNSIVSNISNLETPNYTAKDIDFKAAMAKAMKSSEQIDLRSTDSRHLSAKTGSFQPLDLIEEQEWNGFNRVNIDREMTKLIENNMMYRAAIETLLRKIYLIKEVIKEGGQ